MADAPTAAVPPPAAASAAPPAVPPAPAAAAAARPVPAGWSAVTEGAATILQKGNEVFYNPAQVVNRDLSVAVLSHFSALRAAAEAAAAGGGKRRAAAGAPPRDPALGPGLRVLEGLAASGLRAIRYALEVPGVARVVANDLDPAVAAALRRNVEHNGGAAARLVVPSTGDARAACMAAPGGFDAVDLDPYGSPGRLLDAAVQAASEGGLLLVTATDMAVLCGNHGEACYAKYGAYPLHRPFCHEQALRVLVGALHAAAARHKRVVTPLLSVSIDFYVRVFVTVHTSAVETKEAATKMGYVFQSQGCDSFFWQRAGRRQQKGNSLKHLPGYGPAAPQACAETGAAFTMGGPFWAEPLHDPAFVRGVLAELRARRPAYAAFDRVQGLLASVLDELPDAPLYFDLHAVAKTLRCSAPRAETIRSALVNAGFRASGTHCSPLGVKTDAPWSAIWDIMRCWVAEHPAKPPPGSSGALILAKAPELKADFARAAGAVQHRGKGRGKVARFLPNPEANWGPKPKHGRGVAPSGRHAAAAAAAVGAGAAAAAEPMEAEAAGEATEEEPAAAEDGANGANGAAAEAPAAAVPPQADG